MKPANAEDLAPLLKFDGGGNPDAVMLRYGEARRIGALLQPEVGLIVRLSGAGEDGHDIARPAEFLVDAAGTVRWVKLTDDFRIRARPEVVLQAIDDLHL